MSTFFQWNDRLDIGVKNMNDEHIVLISIMNKLWDQNENGLPKEDLVKTVNELGDYVVKHFSDEEKYMESIKYSEVDKHKIIHQQLLRNFTEHKNKFEGDASGKVSMEFFNFLKMWLSAHIQGIDLKYGKFAKGHKAWHGRGMSC